MYFLTILLALIIICFSSVLYFSYRYISYSFRIDKAQKIEVIKFIEALREVLPITLSSGWSLASTHHGLRCWKRKLPKPLCGAELTLSASTTKFEVPAVTVLNVVADVNSWPEWDPQIYKHLLQAELSEDPQLHGDAYMQSDQLVSLGNPGRPEIYRFGNLESNGTAWILLWNVDKLCWWFYLGQPVESSETSCIVSLIHGHAPRKGPTKDKSGLLASKLSNLKDALAATLYTSRPFHSPLEKRNGPQVPHLPAVKTALSDLTPHPCVLLTPDPKSANKSPGLLTLVPFSMTSSNITPSCLEGFVLTTLQPAKSKRKHDDRPAKVAAKTLWTKDSPSRPKLAPMISLDSKGSDTEDRLTSEHSESDARRNSCFSLGDVSITDFEMMGQQCTSQVLTEVYHSSVIEPNSAQPEQLPISGWMFEGTNKDIMVLSKFSPPNRFSYLSKGEVAVSAEEVWKAVKNPHIRLVYDTTVKRVGILEELSATQKIIKVTQESGGVMRKGAQDFHLLHTEVADNSSKYVVAVCTIGNKRPVKNSGPLQILPSGWVIEPLNPNASMITYLTQVSISGGDRSLIEDIGTSQPHCISSLKRFLTFKPHHKH